MGWADCHRHEALESKWLNEMGKWGFEGFMLQVTQDFDPNPISFKETSKNDE